MHIIYIYIYIYTHTHTHTPAYSHIENISPLINQSRLGGARGVIVIVVGNEHGDTSSNPGRDWLHFT